MGRTEKYQKNNQLENRLEKLNNELEPLEINRINNASPPIHPVTFIVGAPRSATTLTHQLFASTGFFSYITNFIARFWKAPSLGSEIAETLNIYTSDGSSFTSDYGRTAGWHEPHQFNYFWKKWLEYDADHQMDTEMLQSRDNSMLLKQLGAIEQVKNQPLLFKSLYTGLQLGLMKQILGDIRVIVCLRDPFYLVQSNLLGRQSFFGDYTGWFSLKPPEYAELKDLDPYNQVAGQIYYTLKHIEMGLASIPPAHVSIQYYDNFLAEPRKYVDEVINSITNQKSDLGNIPERFENRDKVKVSDSQWQKITSAVDNYFHQDDVPFSEYMKLS